VNTLQLIGQAIIGLVAIILPICAIFYARFMQKRAFMAEMQLQKERMDGVKSDIKKSIEDKSINELVDISNTQYRD
jgi:hypothetical protein